MKALLWILSIIISCGAVFWMSKWRQDPSVAIWSSGPTVTHLEKLGSLVSTKVYLSDVLTGEADGYRGSWLIKGDALIGIDLTKAKVIESDHQRKQAKIRLPGPRVLTARVDHARTK